jgi:hypothetical protein
VTGVSDDERHPDEYCGRTPRLGSILATVLVAITGVIAAGCGGGQEFSAEEFVEEANSHGAGLELGAPLDSIREGAELYEVTVEPAEGAEPTLGEQHGGGTITVTDDAAEAEAEYARCEKTVSLFCYRAANIVLFFDEEASPDTLGRVAQALKAMQSD